MAAPLKTIEVVAGIIRNADGKVLATRCPQHKHNGGWEFPGGKIEPGEQPEATVVRELQEELNLTVNVGPLLYTVEWDYPTFHLRMFCYACTLVGGALTLREHTESRWLDAAALHTVEWLPADVALLPVLEKWLSE